jgi:hypothetical protein
MISAAGFEAGGQSGKKLKKLLALFGIPAAYIYVPLDDLQEKVKTLSAPFWVGTFSALPEREGDGQWA